MSQSPFTAAALRGAVDLSGLKRPAPGPAGAGGGAGVGAATGHGTGAPGAGSGGAVVIAGTEASLASILEGSRTYPVIMVLWSARMPASRDFVDSFATVVRQYGGRLQLVSMDVDSNPRVMSALQVQGIPVSIAFIAGQPLPLFEGVAPADQLGGVLDQVLEVAERSGISGRVPGADAEPDPAEADGQGADEEPALPPLHQQAFDAIEAGDFAGAAAAYRSALAENPADADAKVGLAQVGLLERTADADLTQARAAAAADPADVEAQILVADLDLLGGHIEDAFTRLIDTVRITADAERNRVREHLVELFAVVGPTDERVVKARRSLMSALF